MNIELYIDNRLCDIESPEKLGITLKRVFFNPADFNVKDVQKSYTISLPATAVNNEIFHYANVEETKGKFTIYNNAHLYIDGVLILDGKFRLSEITRDHYKGNLGVPAPLTAKDVFGETMMNQVGSWNIDFQGREGITQYNTGTYDKKKYGDIPPCIFPLVLYGLLPRDKNTDKNPDREVFDSRVQLSLDHLPPSVNCIQMLKKIFDNAKYKLTGSALDDERLNRLYVSYKNPNEYEPLWGTGEMRIKGNWGNYRNGIIDKYQKKESHSAISFNMFDSKNLLIEEKTDPGKNITVFNNGDTTKVTLKVPQTGLYKLFFTTEFTGLTDLKEDGDEMYVYDGRLDKQPFEVKVIRHKEDDNTFMEEQKPDNVYFLYNQDQREVNDQSIFPQAHQVNFVDPKQNLRMICGFGWGGDDSVGDVHRNPLVEDNFYHNPIAISGGRSWTVNKDTEKKEYFRAFSAVENKGYVKMSDPDTPIKFIINIDNIPANMKTSTTRTGNRNGTGQLSQVIWLEKGEKLTLISTSSYIYTRYGVDACYNHRIDFDLSLTPFKLTKEWLAIDNDGSGDPDKRMDWNAPSDFEKDTINLVSFLPAEIKVNDWIDNFCKAFNLSLVNTGKDTFELNTKNNSLATNISNMLDIDKKTSVMQCVSEPLKLPYMYEVKFTVNNNEEGYYKTMEKNQLGEPIVNSGKDGNGRYYTGNLETSTITQSSNFSYNWYKELVNSSGKPVIEVPIISEHEIWDNNYDYQEMAPKRYYNLTQRFWYKSGLFSTNIDSTPIQLATVSERYDGKLKMILDYEDKPESILRNYFLIMVDNDNNYTTVSCYLTANEYANLNKSLIKFNGDLYNVVEVDGYDPLGKNKATLKLIRRIV
ncbi:MAG: hypothetical protein LBV43_05425 [Prevotella sp.]|jgi:hypothetical protein|nr:hypothetical protein [Prevotella sp.]